MKKTKIIVVLLLCVCFLTACGNSKLTMENYNKITVATLNQTTIQYEGGMTLAEVKEILGEHTSSSSNTITGITATAYVWGDEKKAITISFYNDQAILKAQVGL